MCTFSVMDWKLIRFLWVVYYIGHTCKVVALLHIFWHISHSAKTHIVKAGSLSIVCLVYYFLCIAYICVSNNFSVVNVFLQHLHFRWTSVIRIETFSFNVILHRSHLQEMLLAEFFMMWNLPLCAFKVAALLQIFRHIAHLAKTHLRHT